MRAVLKDAGPATTHVGHAQMTGAEGEIDQQPRPCWPSRLTLTVRCGPDGYPSSLVSRVKRRVGARLFDDHNVVGGPGAVDIRTTTTGPACMIMHTRVR